MNLENLTQSQRIAIEGEVAKALITSKHNAEILYRLYTILKSAPKDVAYYIIEVSKEILKIDETKFNKMILEVSHDDYPYWIWIERVVEDLKLSMTLAVADGMNFSEVDKKLAQQMILKSAFLYYCRSITLMSPEATKRLCQYIIDEENLKLGFLSEACFALIKDVAELPNDNDKLPKEVFHSAIDIKDMLSYAVETKVLDELNKTEKKPRRRKSPKEDKQLKLEPTNEDLDIIKNNVEDKQLKLEPINEDLDIIKNTVEDAISKIFTEQLKKQGSKKHERYAIVKKFKGEKGSCTLKAFDSQEEAEEFIKTIKREFPTLYKNCELTIERVNY